MWMSANVETWIGKGKHTASGAICHMYKLDSDGSVSNVALKQKGSKGFGIANKFLQDRSSLM